MSALALIGALGAQVASPPAGAAAPPSPVPSALVAAPAVGQGASTYLDLEAGAGYSTNPLLRFGSHNGSAYGRLALRGVHTRLTERTTTIVSAFLQDQFYTRHFGSQLSADLNAQHDARVSEKLRVFGDADLAYDKGGQLDTRVLAPPLATLPPGVVQPPVLGPSGADFLSVTGRQYRASGHVGAQYALSAHDFITGRTGVEYSDFRGAGFNTRFTTIPFSVGYQRQLNARTTVGARIVGSDTNYNGPGNLRVISPQATIQTALTERMIFAADVGVSFARFDDGIRSTHSTGLSADASLCSTGERSQFCATATVEQEAATVAGPARSQAVGITYSRRLDADQTVQFSLSANHYSAPVSTIVNRTFSSSDYLRAAGEYSRRIGNRFFTGATLAARKVTEAGPDPKTDLNASIFVRYRLGDLR